MTSQAREPDIRYAAFGSIRYDAATAASADS